MSLATDLDEVIGEVIDEAGESVTIYSGTGNQSWTGDALVTSGASGIDDITGGYFEQSAYTVTIRKSDLTDFAPTSGMTVVVRTRELRIANGDLFDGRAHWRLPCVDRNQ